MSRVLDIQLTQPQADFLALDCKYPLFVGGYGSGKSEVMVIDAIIDASHSSDALIALYAPTYDLVKLIIAKRLVSKLEHYGIRHKYNKTNHEIYTSSTGFGDFVLRSLSNPERIVGYESYAAHIDELDILPTAQASEAWDKVTGRNRQKPKGILQPFNRVRVYTTPEGYSFVYDRWVKGESELYKRVHAASSSNPFLPDGYIDALRETYPAQLVEAYVNGQFVNLVGGNVYNCYNRSAHNSTEAIREGERLYIGCDFNVTKQAATIYVRRNGGDTWHAVHELINMYDTPEMIKIMRNKWPTNPIVIYPDASGANRKTVDASSSDIALLEQAGFEVRVNRSNPRVKDRVLAMNAALTKGKVYINSTTCPTVAACLEQQAYDENGQPDKKSNKDHQNDATTYPIIYEMPVHKPVMNIPVSFNL